MDSYFFVPASRLHKIEAIKNSGISNIIVDFEDAILESERMHLKTALGDLNDIESFWFRIPVRDSFNSNLDLTFLNQLVGLGVKKVVVPKLLCKSEWVKLIEFHSDLQFILLVEHPRFLFEISAILMDSVLNSNIYGIGLGSHDLVTQIGAKYNEKLLLFPRLQLLFLAKAYNKVAIDIASMEIRDLAGFEKEVEEGFEYGFDAKFLIHPNQYVWLEGKREVVSSRNLQWAKKILASVPVNFKGNEIEPFVFEGMVIEKPHIELAQLIIKKHLDEK